MIFDNYLVKSSRFFKKTLTDGLVRSDKIIFADISGKYRDIPKEAGKQGGR